MSDPVAEFEAGLAAVEGGFRDALASAETEHALRAANAAFVGPDGELTKAMRLMPRLPGERRRELGQRANALKQAVAAALDEGLTRLKRVARAAELEAAPMDVTLPGRPRPVGRLHPITRVRRELLDIFGSLGFEVADGPEIDFHENCFDRLGFPPDHPATDMQDTFFVTRAEAGADATTLLRTHTSTIQVREMMKRKPPLAVVSPGAVFRRDDDRTHSPMFFQLEGFLVDRDVSFADLKGVLTLFARRLFDAEVTLRFRPELLPLRRAGGRGRHRLRLLPGLGA